MKITHNKVGNNLNTSDSGKANSADKAEKSNKAGSAADSAAKLGAIDKSDVGSSKVDLSPRAQEMKKIKDLANSAPDINEEKVARLQKMIDEGSYKVSAKDIADKMVDEELKWM